MVDSRQIREFVTERWNYLPGVVDNFDEEDYEIVSKSTEFQFWVLCKAVSELGRALIEPFISCSNKIKKAFHQ